MIEAEPPQALTSASSSGPVFVVGQPRSGSTVMTRLLNEETGLFVINDFYVLQQIDEAGLWGPLTSEEAGRIGQWIFARIEIRATEESGKTISQSIDLSPDALDSLRAFAARRWEDGLAWSSVLDRTMTRAAQLAGCSRWGYNTPQDHLHLGRLFQAFPDAKVIFVLRHPAAVLKSYKNVSGPWHDRRRYNPFSIGWAWRVAAHNFRRWASERPGQVLLIRYEELVRNTAETVDRLARFLDVAFPAIELAAFGENSSFSGNRSHAAVTATEVWIGEKAAGSIMPEIGFAHSGTKPSVADLPAAGGEILRSSAFIVNQVLFDANRRKRALRFLRGR